MNRILYRTQTGSHLYGLNEEGSDQDFESVYVPTKEQFLGMQAVQRAKFEKNGSGEKLEEETSYALQHFASLVTSGNFKAFEMLFAPEKCVLAKHPLFQVFLDNREKFLSPQLLVPLLGFAKSNFDRIDKAPDSSRRKELWDKHGYDTKYCAHSWRILKCGLHYMETGEFKVDWSDQREKFFAIKHGKVSKSNFLSEASQMKKELELLSEEYKGLKDEARNEVSSMVQDWVINISYRFLRDELG